MNLPRRASVHPMSAAWSTAVKTRPAADVHEDMMSHGLASMGYQWNEDAGRAGRPSAYPLRL